MAMNKVIVSGDSPMKFALLSDGLSPALKQIAVPTFTA